MKSTTLILFSALLSLCPANSFAQEQNSWGDAFDCAVDWFSVCGPGKVVRENRTDEPNKLPAARGNTSASGTSTAANLPLSVRNVLENPSPETARAYVLWSRQASERLAKASEYIAQATREMNSEAAMFRNDAERSNDIALSEMGPVGLYYFFSPGDQSAVKDVAVLNKIWREGRIGVVGIPVSGKNEEVGNYVNEAKPLFPIRRSDAEVKLVKPAETPDLYLTLPLEKKIFRLGPTITETAIAETIGNILGAQSGRKSITSPLDSNR
jgi:hypothetical protein